MNTETFHNHLREKVELIKLIRYKNIKILIFRFPI